MRFKSAFVKKEVIIIPTFGFINMRSYYGYPVVAIAFAWLQFRCKFEFGVKRINGGNE